MAGSSVSYLLCGTPRTGSTLLCSVMSSTRMLGRPESYFREPDETAWAERFGLPTKLGRVLDYDAFVRAVRRVGTTDNGVFAARIMWGSLERLVRGLGGHPGRSELVTLERAFGRLTFVHLSREDVVAQAVSWCRAEQTGAWQDGDVSVRPPEQDVARTVELVGTIEQHNAAWRSWFGHHGVEPYVVTYEELVTDPRSTVEGLARQLGVQLTREWQPTSTHRKQADELSRRWVAVVRDALRT